MKKIITLLFSLLVLTVSVLAAEPEDLPVPGTSAPSLYPSEVREIQTGEFRRIEKVYLLDAGVDPSSIPTADFEREGYTYTLLDLLFEDRTETESKTQSETITLNSDTQDINRILEKLESTKEFTSEEGFSGTLSLDPASITVAPDGYKTSSKTVTATRTYPGLSDADASLLPKTVQENGRTLEISNVSWQTVPGGNDALVVTYTATVTYTGTASSKYATGYTVTAKYTGELTKIVNGATVYTAVFTGEPIKLKEVQEAAPGWIYAVCILLFILLILAAIVIVGKIKKQEMKGSEKNGEKDMDAFTSDPQPDDERRGTGI